MGSIKRWMKRLAWVMTALVAFDAEATSAMTAQNFAMMCSDAELERIAADGPAPSSLPPVRMLSFECFGNVIGCAVSGISRPGYTTYRLRMQDIGARYRLLGTLAWLRKNADGARPLEDWLKQLPEALKSPTRNIEPGTGGKTLQIRLFAPGADGEQARSVPLPPALQQHQPSA